MAIQLQTATPRALPVINEVRDSNGKLVPSGTQTQDSVLTISGTGDPAAVLTLRDASIYIGDVSVRADGTWITTLVFALGEHSFTANTQAGAVSQPPWLITIVVSIPDPDLDLIRPWIKEAYSAGRDRVRMSDIYRADYITVIVPHYVGMAIGQMVSVHWVGGALYNAPASPVVTLGPMEFTVPRVEVVDVINRSATVLYNVTLPGETIDHPSLPLTAYVEQVITLPAPSISANNRVVTVVYPGQNIPHTARVRWIGRVTHDTAEQNMDTRPEEFDIPAAWVSESAGTEVLINYTVLRHIADEPLVFSWVVRKRV